ncbi:Rrf2 family transcriptional regulator [Acidithiobacillus sp. AMEEHan]|uniref:RrF2 family transcriptional regulator n=1 Tax=Acidithiobacillus sp. AMEEHan TaxID=2994951 RepID=UPI0027E3DEA0|nr:Rrf2 family transcriptional regulator [Acidithiobacillus sp. AMEEHan]
MFGFILSKNSEIALAGLVYLAKHHSDSPARGKEVALHLQKEEQYVKSILRILAKNEILRVVKGKNGGYLFSTQAQYLTVADVVRIVDRYLPTSDCIFRKKICSRSRGCPMQCQWRRLRENGQRLIEGQTIRDLVLWCEM